MFLGLLCSFCILSVSTGEIILAEASSCFAFLSLNSGLTNAKQVQIIFVTLPQAAWSLSRTEGTVGLHLKSSFVGIRWFSASIITNTDFLTNSANPMQRFM